MTLIMKELKNFPITLEIPIAWGDMDSFQHVNNIIFFRYFESTRIKYFQEVGVMDCFKESGIGPILGETSCKFIKALTFPDTVCVGVRVKKLEPERFIHEYKAVSQKLNKVVATGEGKIIAYNYRKEEKSKFPEKVLKAIETLERRPLLFK